MILIVEDDPQVARLISLVLERSGYEGVVVGDADEALARVASARPELIFADLSLAGTGGDALCSRIKGNSETKSIPFVILSGDRDIAEKASVCGADAYLGKPFEFDELIRIVKQYADSKNSSTG